MREHHAFRVSRSTGGKHDLDQVVPTQSEGAGLSHLSGLCFDIVQSYLRNLEPVGPVGRHTGHEGQLGSGPGRHPVHEVGVAPQVDRHGGRSGAHAAEEGQHPLGTVGTPEEDAVALLHSPALE